MARIEERDPYEVFADWYGEAANCGIQEPTAVALATTDTEGQPSLRMVLLKGHGSDGFVFYTNYESRKATEIADNPCVGLSFLWKELERQVLICGTASRLSRNDSEKYFKSRPHGHQIGAWTSLQSNEIPNRQWMLEREAELTVRFSGKEIPLPDFWGGYIVKPHEIEFWQGRENRLHDRFRYEFADEQWQIHRLQP